MGRRLGREEGGSEMNVWGLPDGVTVRIRPMDRWGLRYNVLPFGWKHGGIYSLVWSEQIKIYTS